MAHATVYRTASVLAGTRLASTSGTFVRHLSVTRHVSSPVRASKEVDLVVAGSGCSGLTAAVVAAKHGLRVLVVEKSDYFGGTTAYSGGGAWIPNNKYQVELGITDSSEQAEGYLKLVLGDLYDPDNIKVFLKSGPQMVNWLEANTSVKFKSVPLPDYQDSKKGASAGRTILTREFDGRQLGRRIKEIRYPIQGYSAFGTMQVDPADLSIMTAPFSSFGNFFHATSMVGRYVIDLLRYGKGTWMANGNALVGRLFKSAMDEGVELWNKSPAVRTIVEDGVVKGLVVNQNGQEIEIKATKGVVLASGGFGRGPESKKYLPHDWCVSPKGNVGDGKRMGLESGGVFGKPNPDNGIFAPISLLKPKKGPIRRYPHFAVDRTKPGSIIVDTDGKRFANEAEPYQTFVKTMHEKKITKAFLIGDSKFLRKYGMGMALPWPYPIWRLKRQGYLIQAPTLRALAEKISVNPDTLEETVAKCNENAISGVDPDFHRGESVYDKFSGDPKVKPNVSLGQCTKGPFYALPLYPGNVSSMLGLETDGNARVLGKDKKPIEGLYAVGCDQNSIMHGTYPGGGSSIGPGLTFGYRAGMHAAGATL